MKAEVPGLEPKDLDIQVTRNAVYLSGEHRSENPDEVRYQNFQRIVSLPTQVQNDQVKADIKNGILTLRLPKLEAESNRAFKVNLDTSQKVDLTSQEQSTNPFKRLLSWANKPLKMLNGFFNH